MICEFYLRSKNLAKLMAGPPSDSQLPGRWFCPWGLPLSGMALGGAWKDWPGGGQRANQKHKHWKKHIPSKE
jgi:hypothetical protein